MFCVRTAMEPSRATLAAHHQAVRVLRLLARAESRRGADLAVLREPGLCVVRETMVHELARLFRRGLVLVRLQVHNFHPRHDGLDRVVVCAATTRGVHQNPTGRPVRKHQPEWQKENLARRSPVSSLLNSSLSPCQPWRPPLRSSGRKYQPHLTCSRPFLSNTIPMIAATYGSASLLFNNAVSARGQPSVRSRAAKTIRGAGLAEGGRRTAYPVLHAAFRKQDTPAGRRRRRAPSPAHGASAALAALLPDWPLLRAAAGSSSLLLERGCARCPCRRVCLASNCLLLLPGHSLFACAVPQTNTTTGYLLSKGAGTLGLPNGAVRKLAAPEVVSVERACTPRSCVWGVGVGTAEPVLRWPL